MMMVFVMLRLLTLFLKTIEDCTLKSGDIATIKFGEGLAWATIVEP